MVAGLMFTQHVRLGLTLMVAALLTLLAGQARAQEGGNLIQFVTPWATSSPCFGDASKPLCAVETLIGCRGWARKGPDCARVFPQRGGEGLEKNRVEYYFTRLLIVSAELERKTEKYQYDDPLLAMPRGEFIAIGKNRYCSKESISCSGKEWLEFAVGVGYSRELKAWTMGFSGMLSAFPEGWFDQ